MPVSRVCPSPGEQLPESKPMFFFWSLLLKPPAYTTVCSTERWTICPKPLNPKRFKTPEIKISKRTLAGRVLLAESGSDVLVFPIFGRDGNAPQEGGCSSGVYIIAQLLSRALARKPDPRACFNLRQLASQLLLGAQGEAGPGTFWS